MTLRGLKWKVAAALAVVTVTAGSVQAADVAEFYTGKTVKILVGGPAGDGFDIMGRLLARHIGRHLPGTPNVIVQNMPGAASMTATNWLYNVAPKDGTFIGLNAIGATLGFLYGDPAVQFDPTKFNWIGNMDVTITSCATWHTSGIKTFADIQAKEALFGGTNPRAGVSQTAVSLKTLLGAKVKMVMGYKGIGDIYLALQRGEVLGSCGVPLTLLKTRFADDYKAGKLVPLIHAYSGKVKELPGIPSVYDYVKTAEDKQIFGLVYGWRELGRPISAPPGVPAERLRALRVAFDASLEDPAFKADIKKLDLDLRSSSGEAVEKMMAGLLSTSPTVVKKVTDALIEK